MISDEKLLEFCRDLSAAVRSGLPLSDAFETMAKAGRYGRVMAGAAAMTAAGRKLHEALGAQGGFPPVFLALLRAGEEGGKTEEFLELYAGMLEVRVEFRRRMTRALIYPVFAGLLSLALLLIFAFKVVPMIMAPLAAAGVAVEARPPWLDALAGLLSANWAAALSVAVAGWLLFRAALSSGPGRRAAALAGHWLPGFRYLSEEARLHQVYTTMGLLMKAGLPLGAMMDVLAQFADDDPVTLRRFARAAGMVSGGRGFAESVAPLARPEDRPGLEMAEKTGRLDETLLRLGRSASERHLHRLKIAMSAFRLAVMAALAPLCFLLIYMLMSPVLGLMSGSIPTDGTAPPFSSAPAAPRERDSSGPPAAEDATARFNREQGGKIADFINTRSAGGGSSMPRLKTSIGGGLSRPAGSAGPTDIRPTEIKSGTR